MSGRVVCKTPGQTEKLQAQESNLWPANNSYPGRYITQKHVTAKCTQEVGHPCMIDFMGASRLKTESEFL